tara:strand:+ start:889 stop:1137 length:249 start_codon:yes stop_codon:yes gene_type:complete
MEKRNKFKDILGITSGILESIEGVKLQSKQRIRSKIANTLRGYDLVEREEFNEIKAIILRVREENEQLIKRIKALENKNKKK